MKILVVLELGWLKWSVTKTMSDNDNHQPISGKLYRVMNCAAKSLSAFEGPRQVFGRDFDFDSATQFLLCLPQREDLPRYDFFLVSGSVEIVAWEKLETRESYAEVWLQEVKPEEE